MVAVTLPVDAVIVAVPCLTSVTSPFEDTVATPVFDDDHASTTPVTALPFASVRAAEICVVLPGTPVMAVGDSVIDVTGPGGGVAAVTPTVADTPLAEAVIVAVPALLSVTRPDEDTLATDELDEVQLSVGGVVMTSAGRILEDGRDLRRAPGGAADRRRRELDRRQHLRRDRGRDRVGQAADFDADPRSALVPQLDVAVG